MNFDLLELDELGAANLHVKASIGLGLDAFLARTVDGRREGGSTDRLIGFSSTDITGIGYDRGHRLDLCSPNDDSFNVDQFADTVGLQVTDGDSLLVISRLERDFTETKL